MKSLFVLFISLLLLGSCAADEPTCNCDYVTLERNPTTDYLWTETHREEGAGGTCEDGVIMFEFYLDHAGRIWQSKVIADCE
jgi:hypothetical protein